MIKAEQRVRRCGFGIIEVIVRKTGQGNLRTHLITSTLGVFLLQILSVALAFGSSILLARILGAAGYGIYSYVWSLIMLLTTIVTFGLPQLLIRNISASLTQEKWELMRGLLRFANYTVLIVSLCLITVLIFGIWLISHYFSISSRTLTTFLVSLPVLPLLGFLRVRRMTLQGLGRIIQGELLEYAFAPALFLALILGMCFVLKQEITPPAAIGMQVLAFMITFLVGDTMLKRYLPTSIRETTYTLKVQEWLQSALPLLLIALLQVANRYADILMIGPIKGAEAVGLFKVAFQVTMLVSFTLQAVSVAIGPTIASLLVKNERARLQRIITQGTRAAFLISLPLGIAWILAGQWLLGTIFGQEYVSSSITLALLTIGQLINLMAGPSHTVLIMAGYEDRAIKGWALAVGIHVFLNAIFIPLWGIEGAAIATLISIIVWNALLAAWIYKELGIYMSVLGPSLRRLL